MARKSIIRTSYLLLLLCVFTYAQGNDITEDSTVSPTKKPFKGAGFKLTKEGYYRLTKSPDPNKIELDSDDETEDIVEDDSLSASIDDVVYDSLAQGDLKDKYATSEVVLEGPSETATSEVVLEGPSETATSEVVLEGPSETAISEVVLEAPSETATSEVVLEGPSETATSELVLEGPSETTAPEDTASFTPVSSEIDELTQEDAAKEVEVVEREIAIAEQENEERKELGEEVQDAIDEVELEAGASDVAGPQDTDTMSDTSGDMNVSNFESAAKYLSVEDMLTRDIQKAKDLALVEGEYLEEDAERVVEGENVLESNILDLKASGVHLATEEYDDTTDVSDFINIDNNAEVMSQDVADALVTGEEQKVKYESFNVASGRGQSSASPYDVVTCVRSMDGNKAAVTIVCNIPLINFCQQDAGEECKLSSPSLSAIQTGDIPGLTHQFLFTADFSTLAQGLLNGGEVIHVPKNSNLNDYGMALLDYMLKHYNSWAVLSLDKIEDGVNPTCQSHVITCTMCKNDEFLKGRSHVAPLDISTESVIGTDITRYNLDVTGVIKHLGEIIAPNAIHMLIREKLSGCTSVFNNAQHSPELHVHFEIPSSPEEKPEGWEVKSIYATQWAAESNLNRLLEGMLLAGLDNGISNRFFLSANIPNIEFSNKNRAALNLLLFRKQTSSISECVKPHLIVTLLDEFPFDKEGKPALSLQDINKEAFFTEHALEVETQAYLLDISQLLHKFYETKGNSSENQNSDAQPMHIMVSEKSTGCSTLFANPNEANPPQFTLIYDIKDTDDKTRLFKPEASALQDNDSKDISEDKEEIEAIDEALPAPEENHRVSDGIALCVEASINEGATVAMDTLFDGALEKFKVVGLSATDHVLMNLSNGEYDESIITQCNASAGGQERLSKHYARLAAQAIADKGLSDTAHSAEWHPATDAAISAGFDSIRSVIMRGTIAAKNDSLATKICTSILSKVAPNRVLDAAIVESSPNGEATTLMAKHFSLVFGKVDARKIMRNAFEKAYAAARDAAALIAINQAAFFAENTFVDIAKDGAVLDDDIEIEEGNIVENTKIEDEQTIVTPTEQPKYVRRANNIVDSLNVFLYDDGIEKAKEAAELMQVHGGEDEDGSYILGISWDAIYFFGVRICAVFVGILIIGIVAVVYYKWTKRRKAAKDAKPTLEAVTTQPEAEQELETEPKPEQEPACTPAPTEVECDSN